MNRIYRNEMRNISTKFECHNKRSSYKSEKLAIIEKYASSEIRCSGVHSPRNVAMTYIHIFNTLFVESKATARQIPKEVPITVTTYNIQGHFGWRFVAKEVEFTDLMKRKPEGEFPCT